MKEIQIKFEDVLEKNKKTRKKNTKKEKEELPKKDTKKATKKTVKKETKKATKKTTKNKAPKRVSVTQEDMDKLCEVYDWYLAVKNMDVFEKPPIIEETNIVVEEDIIKEKKRISAVIDNDTWSSFDSLCHNIGSKKGDLLTKALQEFLLKHKDLY